MNEQTETTIFGILKLIPFAIVTAIIVLFWVDDLVGFMIAFIFSWVTLPAIGFSIAFFIQGLRWRDVWQRIAVIWGGINVLAVVVYVLAVAPGRRCNPDIMAKHYEKHHTEMEELHRYLQSAVADSCAVTLEFKGNRLEMFHVCAGEGDEHHYSNFWNEEAREKRDSLMCVVGLTQEEYDGIRQRLKKMGCVGIEYSQTTPDLVKIWFRRVGMGRYDYIINSRSMTDEEKSTAMENLDLIPYNDHCTFQYGGGAIGPQTFSQEEKEDFLKRHKPW